MKLKKYNLFISSGNGPDECSFAVKKVLEKIKTESSKYSVTLKVLNKEETLRKNTYKSILLEVAGIGAKTFCEFWTGTIKCIFKSPFRKEHKRSNWYIAVSSRLVCDDSYDFRNRKLIVKVAKASGPGGQNINKRNTAVRITDIESGVSIRSSEERSQKLNRISAEKKLIRKLEEQRTIKIENQKYSDWKHLCKVERGNENKIFRGIEFERIL